MHPLQKHKEVVNGEEYQGPLAIGKAKWDAGTHPLLTLKVTISAA